MQTKKAPQTPQNIKRAARQLRQIARSIEGRNQAEAAGLKSEAQRIEAGEFLELPMIRQGQLSALVYYRQELKIYLTRDGLQELNAILDYDDARNSGEVLLMDLLEEHTTNGAGEFLSPEDIGALTNAPIIGLHTDRNDAGELIAAPLVYWFPEYETTDPAAQLRRASVLNFSAHEDNATSETAPAFGQPSQAQKDAAALAAHMKQHHSEAAAIMASARRSGALMENYPAVLLAKFAAIIAAEKFAPMPASEAARDFKNLKKFI